MAEQRRPINILFGLPDDGRAKVRATRDGKRLGVTLPGTVSIAPHLSRRRFAANTLYVEPGERRPVKLGPGPLLNHISDPDICSGALKLVAEIVEKSARSCFNHPAAILRTSREQVARTLAGTPGLKVPRNMRASVKTPAELREAVRQERLKYPLLVRVAGYHAGMHMIRVDTPADMDQVAELERRNRDFYVTEFVDFASPDGLYRKYRVAVVGEEIFLRHMIVGEKWLLHAARRTTNTESEEYAVLSSFEETRALRWRPVFREIARRLELDYFGVDCAEDKSGQLLLFEANACMNILDNTQRSPNMWDMPIARIKAALEQKLATPQSWRHTGARARLTEVVA
jgi:glutathione synthase/RimK-type ligase-like ATP-grasp enzyme